MNDKKNLFNLEGLVALVTGATGQLGRAISAALMDQGAVVHGADLAAAPGKLQCKKYRQLDITKASEVAYVLGAVFDEEGRIDILVNNAGVSVFTPFEKRTEQEFDWVMNVNIKGTFNCIQAFVNEYDKRQQKKASIVNVASHYGIISPDFRIYSGGDRKNSEVYGATKAGVIQMTRYFAVHLADRGIRVNSVSPGGVYNPETPQSAPFIAKYSERVPMKRMANQEEIVGGVVYLSGPAANYTTGHNLVIDGGMSCW